MNLFTLLISGLLINNIILTKFLGMCPFMGVSTKLESAVGMGLAVIFVIFGASILAWGLYHFILVPFEELYKSLGIYLPLITTNCAVLYVAMDNITQKYTLVQTMVNSIAVPAGFMMMLVIFATIRRRLNQNDIPKAFQGNPIAFICAAIMAIAFSAFAGLV